MCYFLGQVLGLSLILLLLLLLVVVVVVVGGGGGGVRVSRSSSDSKSPQVSRTLLSVLADLKNTVIKIVSAHPPISYSSSPFPKAFWIVPSAPITTGITVTFVFHSFYFSYYYSNSFRVFHTSDR